MHFDVSIWKRNEQMHIYTHLKVYNIINKVSLLHVRVLVIFVAIPQGGILQWMYECYRDLKNQYKRKIEHFNTYALSPMLFNSALEYAIRRVQVKQDGLKLNGTHQLLAYADYVNILGGGIHTLKENAEALVAATREIGLEVSADKTKYMVMYRDQNAGHNHSVRIDNSTFERVEDFKYLGTNLTIQNSIREEIKSRLRSGNACYHSVQNLLSSRLLSKKLKIKI